MKVVFFFMSLVFTLSSFSDLGDSDCYRFFFVKRAVAYGLIDHEYIVAEAEGLKESEAIGFLKGTEDLKEFTRFRNHPEQVVMKISYLGKSCGVLGERALSDALDYSRAWTEYYDSYWLYLPRMGATPLIGKPCRNIALGVVGVIQPYLEKE
jgi:hypothetical protein